MLQALESNLRTGHIRIALALLLAALLAGCSSDRFRREWPDSTRTAQRPTYEAPGGKPLFLGGYAGANYQDFVRSGR